MDIRHKHQARDLLARARMGVIGVTPDASVLDAIRLMVEHDIGAVVVMRGDQLAGILSERDCARKLELEGRTARDTPAHAIMNADVVTVAPDASVDQCIKLMAAHRVRHLPVCEEGRIVGVLSARDVLEDVIVEDQARLRDVDTQDLINRNNPGIY
jgi:CBS domain-containing protein